MLYISQSGTIYKWLDGHCILFENDRIVLTNKKRQFKVYFVSKELLDHYIVSGKLLGRIEKFNERMN